MALQWSKLFSQRTGLMSSSIIREILKFAQQPDLISLAGGWPAAGLFPNRELAEICQDVLTGQSEEALQYGVTEGYGPLRRTLVEMAQAKGVPAGEGNILVTSGSQQGLDLVGRLLIDPGDSILVERPTYLGGLRRALRHRAVGRRWDLHRRGGAGPPPATVQVRVPSG